MVDAAEAGIAAARASRIVAASRPNPIVQTQVENIAGSGQYAGSRSAETTVSLAIPVELGGKRAARIAVADAQVDREALTAAMTKADIRLQVTLLYIEAVAAERLMLTAQDQARIAVDASTAARIRVQAGRSSPLEEQRANVARINADAGVERARRRTHAARLNLARRIGHPVMSSLDMAWFERLPATQGPVARTEAAHTLALAAADADLAIADARMGLARSQRIPTVDVGPGIRRLSATGDTALVFTMTVPIPVFSSGAAAIRQARAQRDQAEAIQRATILDLEQAIMDAEVEADNAATTARTANGAALIAAGEAARIARIGYREGKFGQLDLLDAERTLSDTRVAAIDALATYQNARARLERLTTPVPAMGN
jgi:cobalt-zinc-cadmium efflux system outer membrane protein